MCKNSLLILFRVIGGLFPTVTYLLLPYLTSIDISAGIVGVLSVAFIVSTLLRFGVDQYILKAGVNQTIGSTLINTAFTQLIVLTLVVFTLAFFFIQLFQFLIAPRLMFDDVVLQTVILALPISILSIGFAFFASQSMKMTSIISFNILPYALILLGVTIFESKVLIIFLAFSIPCLYLLRFMRFNAVKSFSHTLLANVETADLSKIYVVSLLAVLLTNMPVVYAMHIAIDELIYSTGVFVRLIGLSSFISTICYTLFARELRAMTAGFAKQFKYLFVGYFFLGIGFSLLGVLTALISQYYGIFGDSSSTYQIPSGEIFIYVIVLLPLITIGNIIGYLLLVSGHISYLILGLLVSNGLLVLSYSNQTLVSDFGITMLYFYALVLDSIIKIGFYLLNLAKESV